MRKSIAMRMAAVGTAITLAGAMAIIASGTTGAYFSDTKTASIGGTVGSVKISTLGSTGVGADNLNFSFTGLMPGVAQTATVNFRNVGTAPQDVYLTFPNVAALHAINNLGHYGEIHVVDTAGTHLFDSVNLSDGRPDASGTCGTFRPENDGCWPLPQSILVARNVPANGTGAVSFSFNYATILGTATTTSAASSGGGAFNVYPSPHATAADSTSSGTGLPVNVVAVQVGQQP